MRKKLTLLLLFLVAHKVHAECGTDFANQTIQKTEHGAYLVITATNIALSSPDEFPTVQAFQSWIRKHVNPDPIELLIRQRSFYAEHIPEEVPLYDKIIDGSYGHIRPMNCLEAYLLNKHFQVRQNFQVPQEFGGPILRLQKGNHTYWKIYFQSNSEASVPHNLELEKSLDADLVSGWEYYGFIHSHPFILNNPSGDIAGTTIPSPPDRNFFKKNREKRGLQRSLITNGFHTIEMTEPSW